MTHRFTKPFRQLSDLWEDHQSLITFIVGVALVVFPYAFFIAPPLNYPEGTVIHIETGSSVGQVGAMLQEKHIIQSVLMFKLVMAFNTDHGVQAGSYSLPKQNLFTLAYRMATGQSGLDPVKVTIPEGATTRDVGEILKYKLGDFEENLFLELARTKEGYLFPDTYFFLPGTPPSVVVSTMLNNYEVQIAPLRAEIASSTHSEAEIITMASLLQMEARKPATMATIAGILWKRISINMPLQVDAVFGYIYATSTFSPTFDQLATDSPYNTYKNKGLPPGPITNPGMDAILAALRPTKTSYLYYLTGSDGVMYYAKTFAQHVANRSKLR